MKKLAVLRLLIVFLGIVSLAMLFPFALAIMLGETAMIGVFGLCIACPLAVSLPVFFFTRKTQKEFNAQEGILLVFLGWALACFLGAMPYWGSGLVPRFADAVFESVSGFTTTGASIIPDVEILPRSLNLWRAMTHWLGGMGIIVLTVALLPLLGVGGFQLLKAETTGPEKEKFTPNVTATAKILWLIYLGLTALLAILLAIGGMSWFDAVVHAFSTIATGGFSSYNNSIAHFRSAYIDWVCVFFMLLSGLNFTLIYRLLQGRFREAARNSEARAYLLIALAAGLLIALSLFPQERSVEKSLRSAFFHGISIMTTTGFTVADHNAWPPLAQAALFLLMLTGACSGSTAGGVKVVRYVILCKQARNEMKKLLYPKGVFSIQLDKRPGRKDVVYGVAGFVFLYFALAFAGTLLVSSSGIDLFNSINASLSALGNIGLGLGELTGGAIFYRAPDYVKWGMSFLMVAGRLELWTVFILFMPEYWKG